MFRVITSTPQLITWTAQIAEDLHCTFRTPISDALAASCASIILQPGLVGPLVQIMQLSRCDGCQFDLNDVSLSCLRPTGERVRRCLTPCAVDRVADMLFTSICRHHPSSGAHLCGP